MLCKCKEIELQKRVKISAVVDIILAAISLTTGGTDLNKLQLIKEDPETTPEEWDDAHASMALLYVVMIIAGIKLGMGVVLWKGATQRDHKKCRIWLISSFVLWVIQVLDFITKLAVGTLVVASTISSSLGILFRIPVMLAVFTFMKEIQRAPDLSDLFSVRDKEYGTIPSSVPG